MHKHTQNTRYILNEVSSAQISSIVLVVLMILSVTRLSLTPRNPRLCVCVCVSQPASEWVCINIYILNRIPAKASCRTPCRWRQTFSSFPTALDSAASIWSLCENVWGSVTPRGATQPSAPFICLLVVAYTGYIQGFHKHFSEDPEYKWHITVNANTLIVSVCQSFLLGITGYWGSRPVSRC